MKTTVMNPVKAFTLIALGLAIAAMGIYVANADDAPGAAGLGMLLMVAGVVLGVKAARNRLPKWAARTAIAVGVVAAGVRGISDPWGHRDCGSLPAVAGRAIGRRPGAVAAICGGRRARASRSCAQPSWSRTCPACP